MPKLSLERTFHPKYCKYPSDGKGRDTYITQQNGGMCKVDFTPNLGSTFMTKTYQSPSFQPSKQLSAVNYYASGTGRDSYISHNSGGMKDLYLDQQEFKLSLRTHKKSLRPNCLAEKWLKNSQKCQKSTATVQMRTTKRLFNNTKSDRKISMLNMKSQARESLRDKLFSNKQQFKQVKEKFETFRNKFCMSTGRDKIQEKINLNLAYGRSNEFSSILNTLRKTKQKSKDPFLKLIKYS
ncbi:unnamed protein product [Moneuplotes crassus]|uniref:Uncharacterized protein n=1 Tax=Euplotes crassus TaxID=5936 RepID=A0AAD1XQJ7_EUPCR|nr:unnamed protein product [Moneuplotes crassus]